ncbi:tripartite tricarboxylate transporter TctB family protein [Pseudarthrobacter sp. RMG13]|uniref:Tripartite tricarboxylate transporter TctB family protein n=1 Tax=Pseudarthrobacter humi TaxID=2952523 RepID=A0ABT1LY23_9MICC|nr:tripartite tricarboxylate transporter TctB family protein [Pseudarthrobacter humi]MCP9002066.1 tripartite tricarboxylate transporter TctB family protein [Pseudarthrobacter humi]
MKIHLEPQSGGTAARLIRQLGVPVVLLAIALLTIADGLRIVTSGQDNQSGFFILAIGLCFVLFIIISSPLARIGRPRRLPQGTSALAGEEIMPIPQTDPAAEEQPAGYMKQVLIAVALIIVWALALPWIGFAISNGLFLIAFMILVGRRKILSSVLLGAVIGAGTAFGFSALGVVLPQGIFGI